MAQTNPAPAPESLAYYASKMKIKQQDLQISGVEKEQRELNHNRPQIKAPQWIFNATHNLTMDVVAKRFQELVTEILTTMRRQEEDEAAAMPQKTVAQLDHMVTAMAPMREQMVVKFKETPCSLQIHIRKIITNYDLGKKQMAKGAGQINAKKDKDKGKDKTMPRR